MSYDVTIGSDSFNYTWNLGAFFRDHSPMGIAGLNGLTGRDGAEYLWAMMRQINATYDRIGENGMSYKYNPANGWGSVVGAVLWLTRIMAACHANPRKRLSVS